VLRNNAIPLERSDVTRPALAFFAMTLFVAASECAGERLLRNIEVRPGAEGSTLVVLLHGYTLDGETLRHVQATIETVDGLRGADFLRPDLPLGRFSMASSGRITAELLASIDSAWTAREAAGRPYQRVVLVGHSAGGLYARKVYAVACGENPEAPFEDDLKQELTALQARPVSEVRPWAQAVDRIVLVAGMNRGWSISHHMSLSRAVLMQVGAGIGHVLGWIYGRPPIIFTIRRGSPFITNLRLQWLAMRDHANVREDKAAGRAVTVQLLGTIDDLVSPDDNIDLVSGADFIYLEVPQSGHRNVIEMGEDTDGDGAEPRRQKALRDALGEIEELRNAVGPIASALSARRDVTDVVFVIHGIRDEGYWTRKIAYRAQRAGALEHRIIETETSSYGYFPMLSFLIPGARREKVEWLMDRYTEARATYPGARFHYVGHSHGTYLLAKALQDYRAVRFENVVFAGSVVHRAYEWPSFVREGRVRAVLNFVATGDWVVAFFPNALQTIGWQDLGSAGHDGFDSATATGPVMEPQTYIVGGHSAALQESMWDAIAEFALTGNFKVPQAANVSPVQAWWVATPAKAAPLIWLAIAVLLVCGFYLLVRLRVREWIKTLAIVAYCGLLWLVLTEL
jgi:pimeloyl-ACP methyl ester carboxylesterase